MEVWAIYVKVGMLTQLLDLCPVLSSDLSSDQRTRLL